MAEGETNLSSLLREMSVSVRPETYVVVPLPPDAVAPALGNGVGAVIEETEGATVIATRTRATTEQWPYDFAASWLTLEVHSSLEAVGLTAAFSGELGRVGIPCNVIAGFYHDHILVPVDQTKAAIKAIEGLAS